MAMLGGECSSCCGRPGVRTCCYCRPTGGQAVCLNSGISVSLEITGIEVLPPTPEKGSLTLNLDPMAGGMPENPQFSVTGNCIAGYTFGYESERLVPGEVFFDAATYVRARVITWREPSGDIKTTLNPYNLRVGFIETSLNNYFTGYPFCRQDGTPVFEFSGTGTRESRWPLWSGCYCGIGNIEDCLEYGTLIFRITVEDIGVGGSPPPPPQSIYSCFQGSPPAGEGWVATGRCEEDMQGCLDFCPCFRECESGDQQALWESTNASNYMESFRLKSDFIDSDSDTPTETALGLEYGSGTGNEWRAVFGGPSFELLQYSPGSGGSFFLRGICGSADNRPGYTLIYLDGSLVNGGTVRHTAAEGAVTEWVDPPAGVYIEAPDGSGSPFFTGTYTVTSYSGVVASIELKSRRQLLRRIDPDCADCNNPLP